MTYIVLFQEINKILTWLDLTTTLSLTQLLSVEPLSATRASSMSHYPYLSCWIIPNPAYCSIMLLCCCSTPGAAIKSLCHTFLPCCLLSLAPADGVDCIFVLNFVTHLGTGLDLHYSYRSMRSTSSFILPHIPLICFDFSTISNWYLRWK